MSTLLMIILVLLLVGALPTWPYSSGWGYYPAGGLGVVLLMTLVVAVVQRKDRLGIRQRRARKKGRHDIRGAQTNIVPSIHKTSGENGPRFHSV